MNINVSRNFAAEEASVASFKRLQDSILTKYGLHSPTAPVLRLRNATQTSIVLSWDPINLATASLRSLALYRNDSKAGNIPRPFEMQSTKISGLAIDTEYTFHLVLRTSAGTYSSQKLKCRTHKMTDLSGITVTPGIMPPAVRVSLGQALERIGGKLVDNVRIDTTHFVCTEAGGEKWEKAVKQNIPVVRPEWVDGCEREGTIVGVRGYYLDADPKMRQIGPNVRRQSSMTTTTTTPNSQTESPLPPTPKDTNGPAKRGGSVGNIGNNIVAQKPQEPPKPPPTTDKPENTEQKQETPAQPPSTNATADVPSPPPKPKDADTEQPSHPTEAESDPAPPTSSSDGPVNGVTGKEQSPYAEDKPDVQTPSSPPASNKDEPESKDATVNAVNGTNGTVNHESSPGKAQYRREQTGSEGENLEEVPL